MKVNKYESKAECTPIWQYLLLMCADLQAVAETVSGGLGAQLKWLAWGLERIGQYHTDAELGPLAMFVDEFVEQLLGAETSDDLRLIVENGIPALRGQLERLAGWEH